MIGWNLDAVLFMTASSSGDPQHKVNNDCPQKRKGQDGWAVSIIEPALTPLSYTLGPPVEGKQCVYHGGHRD